MHGDAAFAGQGVVAETLNLSQLRGYRTGGTVHVVVNNQVGFTTSPSASRSSLYCTDIARMIAAPIFHVNGDDPEACVRVAKLAVEYRREFKKDVVIDMVCYRRRGHNEADNPSFTQPQMYDIIDNKRSVRKLYTEALVGRGDITLEDAEAALKDFQAQLEKVFVETRNASGRPAPEPQIETRDARPSRSPRRSRLEVIKRDRATPTRTRPDGLHHPSAAQAADRPARRDGERRRRRLGHRRAVRVRRARARGPGRAAGRAGLAARHVHPAARDADRPQHRRGVHAAAAPVRRTRRPFWAYDSLLSRVRRDGLRVRLLGGCARTRWCCWEAQFGDFADGAQTIIDEFISSGEAKWGQRSAVSLLLPHGYEGQGPDHSSGRPERFLQLAAENNMTVAICSSPANYFHLLRRQGLSPVRRPLIAFTPKSLLRLKAAVSQLDEFTTGTFQPGDRLTRPPTRRRCAGCCCARGKVYYDLAAAREPRTSGRTSRSCGSSSCTRCPAEEIAAELAKYPDAELVWVQEEPANQGAWPFMALNLPEHLGGRPAAARVAPRVGLARGRLGQRARGAAARGRRHRLRLSPRGSPGRSGRSGGAFWAPGQSPAVVGADIAASPGSELHCGRGARRATRQRRSPRGPRHRDARYGSYRRAGRRSGRRRRLHRDHARPAP